MTPTLSFSLDQVAAAAGKTALDILLAQPAYVFALGLFLLPWLALWALNGRLQPGALPHHVGEVAAVPAPVARKAVDVTSVIAKRLKPKRFEVLENDAVRALRRVSRERGAASALAREEAKRKLLHLQSRIRFSETSARQSHEHELTRLLVEAARHGITVTPEEAQTAAA